MFPLAHSRGWPCLAGKPPGRRAYRRMCRGVDDGSRGIVVGDLWSRDGASGMSEKRVPGRAEATSALDGRLLDRSTGCGRRHMPHPASPSQTSSAPAVVRNRGPRCWRWGAGLSRAGGTDFGFTGLVRYSRPVLVTCACSSTDRASDYGSEGLGFESLQAHQPKTAGQLADLRFCVSRVMRRSSHVAGIPTGTATRYCNAVTPPVEQVAQLVQGGPLLVQGGVAVGIHRLLDRRVTRDFHGLTWRHAERGSFGIARLGFGDLVTAAWRRAPSRATPHEGNNEDQAEKRRHGVGAHDRRTRGDGYCAGE